MSSSLFKFCTDRNMQSWSSLPVQVLVRGPVLPVVVPVTSCMITTCTKRSTSTNKYFYQHHLVTANTSIGISARNRTSTNTLSWNCMVTFIRNNSSTNSTYHNDDDDDDDDDNIISGRDKNDSTDIDNGIDNNNILSVDTVIIGAGVVGLAIARELSIASGTCLDNNREIIVIETNKQYGCETSSRNSEVIHSGLYYPTTSYKTKFCIRGKQLLYNYCTSNNNIFTNQCGKLIVSTSSSSTSNNNNKNEDGIYQKQQIQYLYNTAHKNGVTDVRILSKDDVFCLEPSIMVDTNSTTLYSPSTGIIDSHTFMSNLVTDCETTGNVTFVYNSKVTNGRIRKSNYSNNNTNNNNNNYNKYNIELFINDTWFSCRTVINCAGLWANDIATKIHSNIILSDNGSTNNNSINNNNTNMNNNNKYWMPPPLYYAKGTYYTLTNTSNNKPFQHLIYPLPEQGGLGIHATIDQSGYVKFGPDVEWIDCSIINNPDTISLQPTTNNIQQFYKSIRNYYPDLVDNTIQPDYCGIRPKLSHPSLYSNTTTTNNTNTNFDDFLIVTSNEHSIPGLIHLFGIESPGLTSSMAIAEYIVDIILQNEQ